MRFRFKSVLFFIGILIIACAVIGIGYTFYKEVIIGSDIVVDGDLTINYLNGKKFKLNGNNTIEFSVTNNSDEQRYYYIKLTDVHASGVSYNLKSTSNLDIKNDLKDDFITNQTAIDSKETINYSITFNSTNDESYSGVLQIGNKENDSNTFINVLLKNNGISDIPITNIGESSNVQEGLIPEQDDTGLAYYFRGVVSNNNVSFANLKWKIVKINGDGSIKLVLDNITGSLSKYSDGESTYSNSIIKIALSDWFNNNLSAYTEYIAYHKFCNDNVIDGDNINYISYTRLIKNRIPTYMCVGEISNDKIGLLTADEIMFAGGSDKDNTSYYLYNSDIETVYYTMSGAKKSSSSYYPFVVNTKGALATDTASNLLRGVRPVINIVKNAKVTGSGTTDDPYEIILNEN